MSSVHWLAAALIGAGLVSQSSCGGKATPRTGTLDEPIPGAPCEAADARVSSDGCLECVCRDRRWACTAICAPPAGGSGGSGGSSGAGKGATSGGGKAGHGTGGAVWTGMPPPDLVCDVEEVTVTPSELSPTDGCEATYTCSEGVLVVSCDGENDGTGTSLCDCDADGEFFYPYGELFEGEGPDSCFNALSSCVRAWVPDTALGVQAACQEEPDEASGSDDELELASLLVRAWQGCPDIEPLLPGAAGIEFAEAGTWTVLYESNGEYSQGSGGAETGSWEIAVEAQPFVVLVASDGSTREYDLTLASSGSQMTLTASEAGPGTGRYLALPGAK